MAQTAPQAPNASPLDRIGRAVSSVGRALVRPGRLAVLVAVALAAGSVGLGFEHVTPDARPQGEILPFLITLAVVALVVERGIEVVVGMWRVGDRSQLELAVRQARAGDAEHEARAALADFRVDTRRYSLVVGGLIGVMISAVGLRALATLIGGDVVTGLADTQESLLVAIDVIVTGGLIGGGADGAHKVVAFFTSHLERGTERAREIGVTV